MQTVQRLTLGEKQVVFSLSNGLFARLSYHGVHGWRLQSATCEDGFEDLGASQALARFMGESIPDLCTPLVATEAPDALTLTAPDGTKARLSLGAFSLGLYTADGREMYMVTELSTEDGRTVMRGSLAAGEGIYGGGERFDCANRRGTAFLLYICDGWNRADTSYMSVPLFVSSRGAGMLINRYEKMWVDFGAEEDDVWCVTLEHDAMDCYFYANGDISAPYYGYAELSGHAYMPEEWAQGVIICRYAPDMRGYDDMPEFTTPLTYDDVIAAPVPKQAEPECKNLWIKRFSRATGELSYVKVDHYEDDDEYTYDASLVYFTRGGGKYYRVAYYLRDGAYYRSGSKGSPGGSGVSNLTEAFIRAGMKPQAMLMEAFDWGNISRDLDFCRGREAELKKCVDYLHGLGIKAMVYMGLGGGMSPCTKGFCEDYLVKGKVIFADGKEEITTALPQVQGGENPDLGSSSRRGYIDITNPEAMDWYFNVVWEQMLRIGIDGVKIDFCEFVPDEKPDAFGTRVEYMWHDPSVFGKGDIHHAFPTYFISVFYRKILEMKKEMGQKDGFVVFSRGGGLGSQRNPYLWAGDQTRTFEKIEDQYLALLTSGLSGVPFMSYDMAGYQYQEHEGYYSMGAEEGRLFARAVECTAFTPNIQTHGDVRQAFEMPEETQEIYRLYTALHAELMPYIQKVSRIACDRGLPVVRHMVLRDPGDANVTCIEDQFFLGEDLLVCPVFADGVDSREVYLPRGRWLELATGKEYAGECRIECTSPISRIPLFLDLDGEDAESLGAVFGGKTWARIKSFS